MSLIKMFSKYLSKSVQLVLHICISYMLYFEQNFWQPLGAKNFSALWYVTFCHYNWIVTCFHLTKETKGRPRKVMDIKVLTASLQSTSYQTFYLLFIVTSTTLTVLRWVTMKIPNMNIKPIQQLQPPHLVNKFTHKVWVKKGPTFLCPWCKNGEF